MNLKRRGQCTTSPWDLTRGAGRGVGRALGEKEGQKAWQETLFSASPGVRNRTSGDLTDHLAGMGLVSLPVRALPQGACRCGGTQWQSRGISPHPQSSGDAFEPGLWQKQLQTCGLCCTTPGSGRWEVTNVSCCCCTRVFSCRAKNYRDEKQAQVLHQEMSVPQHFTSALSEISPHTLQPQEWL